MAIKTDVLTNLDILGAISSLFFFFQVVLDTTDCLCPGDPNLETKYDKVTTHSTTIITT